MMQEELDAILAADFGPEVDPAKLAVILYNRCYTGSIFEQQEMHRLPDGRSFPTASVSDRSDDMTRVLEAANSSRAAWDEGWRIDQMLDGGRILARKGNSARAFLPGEYLTHRGIGSGPEAGALVSILITPGSAELQRGYYYAFGETVSEFEENEQVVRFFWNVTSDGAPRLMESVTRKFNVFQIPFRFKCASRTSDYPRRDAAVLYLHSRYYPIAALVAEEVHAQLSPWLDAGTPLFAKRLADGLAFAEDPGESFGENRSKILAAAMVATRGKSLDERRAEVRRAFDEHGLSLDRPWLNPGSLDRYQFPFPVL
jgi:type III HopA1-like effector protein